VTFASFGLPTAILKGIRAAGFTEPTAIQNKAIPVILEGNDLIGAAQSGSGKTGAYVIPILARLIDNTTTRLRALILAPTRELAQYIETRTRDYARYTHIKVGVVFTGAPLQQQERMLREQPVDILVATPGRLLELHARGVVNFEDVELLVLDEADRMVGLGLAPDLRKLLKLLPETRQTIMFAITMPPELNRLTKEALIEPVRVDMALPPKPSAGITQAIYPVPKDLKFDLLDDMLSRAEVRSTILFCRHRSGCERHAKGLQRRGYSVAILDEHPSQGAREEALEDLKRGRIQILLASDAAARSLDVTGLSHVINVDVPQTPEDYVHRLGRTGRQDPVGDVFTLMSPEEQREVAAIERLVGRAIPRVLLPDFDYGMRPREIKQAVSYGDERLRRPSSNLQSAVSRIAVAPRSGSASSVRPIAVPRPAVKPAPAGARGKSAPAKPAARPVAKPAVKKPLPRKPASKVGVSKGAKRR
jgi:ATP-dependent RNA helicase RhlE